MAPTSSTAIDSASEMERAKHTEHSTAIRIRSYDPHDHHAVIEVFSSGLLDYSDQEGQPTDLANIESVYFDSGGHFWVATVDVKHENEAVVGIVGLESKSNNQGELRRMSVKSEYRRYGVGRLLVAKLEQWAQSHGLTKVFLSTGSPMAQAHKFYKAIGYEHTTTHVYPTVEMLVFEKQLL